MLKQSLQKLIERGRDMTPSFIMKQLILYEKLAEGMNPLTLDTTNRSVDESMSSLLAFIDKNLK
jgi:hypothetical protein